MTESTVELLDRLIAFPTISRNPNRDLIDAVRGFLGAHGVACQIVPDATGAKANLFATIGPGEVPGVMLAGHTDVVPPDGQAWSADPFRLALRDDRLYGRGTADMKGFVASALHAAALAAGRDLKMPLHLALSYDEEIGCVGVRSLLDLLSQAPIRPRFCIVGEPTGLQIATGHKGKIALRATCCGTAAHSAMAPKALNAIHLALDFVADLRAAQAEFAARGPFDPAYETPYSTIHVGKIAGGTALNIVPDRATVDFEIRHLAAHDPDRILAAIEAAAARIAGAERARFPVAAIEVEIANRYPGLDTRDAAAILGFMQGLVEAPETRAIDFGTEGGLYQSQLGVPTVVCGPGSMDQGHKPDEYVSLDQLDACDRMMARLIDRLAA